MSGSMEGERIESTMPSGSSSSESILNKKLHPKKSRTVTISILVIVVAILLVGGGAWAYVVGWNPFQPKLPPEQVISKMLDKVSTLKSAHYDVAASFKSEPREAGAKPLTVDVSPADKKQIPILTATDLYQYLPVEIEANLHVTGQSQANVQTVSNSNSNLSAKLALGDSSFSLGVDTLQKDGISYIRVNEAPSLGFFDLAALKGKWIKATADDLHKTFLGDLTEEDSANKPNDQSGARMLKQYQIVFSLLKEENLLQVSQEFPQEKTDQGKLYHYAIKLDHSKFADFYQRLAEKDKQEFGDDSPVKFDQETLTYLQSPEFAQLQEALEQNTQLELWVGAKDFLPRKISYNYRLVPPNDVAKLKDTQYRITLLLGLADINKPVTVEAPMQTISTDEARSLLFGQKDQSSGSDISHSSKSADNQIISDIGQLRTFAEVYYDSNQASFAGVDKCLATPNTTNCTENVANIQKLKADLAKVSGGNSHLEVNATKTKYCISHNLQSDPAKFVCMDSTGQILQDSKNSCGTTAVVCQP